MMWFSCMKTQEHACLLVISTASSKIVFDMHLTYLSPERIPNWMTNTGFVLYWQMIDNKHDITLKRDSPHVVKPGSLKTQLANSLDNDKTSMGSVKWWHHKWKSFKIPKYRLVGELYVCISVLSCYFYLNQLGTFSLKTSKGNRLTRPSCETLITLSHLA